MGRLYGTKLPVAAQRNFLRWAALGCTCYPVLWSFAMLGAKKPWRPRVQPPLVVAAVPAVKLWKLFCLALRSSGPTYGRGQCVPILVRICELAMAVRCFVRRFPAGS